MKVLVSGGKTGQLRFELERSVPAWAEAVFTTRETMDVTDAGAVMAAVSEHQPDCIINASAYTAVDKAESDRDAAFAVNRDGALNLAKAARSVDARLVHVSTDFVFDGQHASPYKPDHPTNPIGVYGQSKLEGEIFIRDQLPDSSLIVRTSWVYSSAGNNFVKTMLRLMSERSELGIISDQVGTPTWAKTLSDMLWQSVEEKLTGIHHWTDAGVASWYDFAQAIHEEGLACGLLQSPVKIKPLTTEQYPTPARRPAYSVLEKSQTWEPLGTEPEHWRVSLRKMMQEL